MAPLEFYRLVLRTLIDARAPFMVGGGYALMRYIGVSRKAHDFDIMIRRPDWPEIARTLRAAGIFTRLTFPHWLGKARIANAQVDIIFNGGSAQTPVDSSWFANAHPARVLGLPVTLVPPEELLWSKSFVMERERFDGADVLHLIHALAERLDWRRLCDRFADNAHVFVAHLVLFRYAFPGEWSRVPEWVLPEMMDAMDRDLDLPPDLCRGTALSREQYLVDLQSGDYVDVRRPPFGTMSDADLELWTNAIKSRRARRVLRQAQARPANSRVSV